MTDTENRLLAYCEQVRNELKTAHEGDGEGEYEDIFAYISDALDVDYRLSSQLELLGVCLYTTLGGPNVWIDTYHNTIEGRWGSSSMSIYVADDICDEINDYYAEYLSNFIR